MALLGDGIVFNLEYKDTKGNCKKGQQIILKTTSYFCRNRSTIHGSAF